MKIIKYLHTEKICKVIIYIQSLIRKNNIYIKGIRPEPLLAVVGYAIVQHQEKHTTIKPLNKEKGKQKLTGIE